MTESEAKTDTLGDALPREIERIQAKIARWQGYAKDIGPQGAMGMNLTIQIMQAEVRAAIKALAEGDLAASIRTYQSLKDYSDDD